MSSHSHVHMYRVLHGSMGLVSTTYGFLSKHLPCLITYGSIVCLITYGSMDLSTVCPRHVYSSLVAGSLAGLWCGGEGDCHPWGV